MCRCQLGVTCYHRLGRAGPAMFRRTRRRFHHRPGAEVFAAPICMTVARLSMFVLQYFYDNLTIDRPRRHSCARRSTSGCCSHFVIPAADALSVPIAIWPTISGLMYDAKPGQRTPEPSSRRFSDETQPRRQPQLKLSDTQCETLYTKSVPKALASTITQTYRGGTAVDRGLDCWSFDD